MNSQFKYKVGDEVYCIKYRVPMRGKIYKIELKALVEENKAEEKLIYWVRFNKGKFDDTFTEAELFQSKNELIDSFNNEIHGKKSSRNHFGE